MFLRRAQRTSQIQHAPIPSRVLGKTNVRLPILGLGTAAAGRRLGLQDALQLYETALDAGIVYFDTAPAYAGYGNAQVQLGHLLRERRQEVFLVTKCFEPVGEAALKVLQQSLKELQTDHADLVFVHSLGADKMNPQVVFSRSGAYPALMRAKAQGLTRFVGFSGHNRPGRFAEAIERVEVDALLTAVNFIDEQTYNFDQRVLQRARALKIGVMAMKVFGGAEVPPPPRLSHALMPAKYHDMAFRYALGLPSVTCAAVGMATLAELQQNLRRASTFAPLSRADVQRLHGIGQQLAREWGAHFGAIV